MKKLLFSLLFVSTFGFGQDLIVTGVSSATAFGAGDIFTGTVTVKNTGIVDINNSAYVPVFFSADNILDDSDLKVGYGLVYSLKAGSSSTVTLYGNKQINLPVGSYYVLADVDNWHEVVETDETNNLMAISGYTIGASNFDFKFSSFSSNSVVAVHDTFNPQFQLAATGTYSSVNRLFTEFFISSDQTLDASDLSCGQFSNWLNQSLDNSTGYPWGSNLEIPKVTPGQYYMIAKVDANNDYVEIDEANNTYVSGIIDVQGSNIDLQPTALTVYNSNPSYVNIIANLTVQNNGTTYPSNVYFKSYLSTDKLLSGEDVELYSPESNVGMPFGNYNLNLTSYGVTPPDGAYFLIIVVDPYNQLDDTNLSNNIIASEYPIYLGAPHNSLSIQSASFTGSYDNTDTSLSLQMNVQNNGQNYFIGNLTYQLTITDGANNVKHTSYVYPYVYVEQGQSSVSTLVVNLSSPLPYGSYNVNLSCADPNNCQNDSYNFTLDVTQPLHALSGKIQGEDGTPLSSGKLFLYQKDDNGNVKFIQKVVPVTSTDFVFNLDNHKHALYFIPDAASSQYVPTIFEKTVVLGANNFFSITKDSAVTFEILKIQSLPAGSMMISGNVVTGSGSVVGARTSSDFKTATAAAQSAASIPVLLLNGQGTPVASTQTDASGNYEFSHLPAGNYQLVVSFELDAPSLMKVPVQVDVSTQSKDVSIDFSNGLPSTQTKTLQAISFGELAKASYTDEPINLGATASSGLAISYRSSNTAVATIVNNQIKIVGVGTTNISASQQGDNTYKAANEVMQLLEVGKGVLTFTAQDQVKTYGESNPALPFTISGFKAGETVNSSGIIAPSTFTGALQNSDAGTYQILFSGGDGGANYTVQFVNGTLTVNKAEQVITFISELPDVSTHSGPITLQAESSAELPVSFSVTQGSDVATLNGNVLTLTGKPGSVTVTALQNGDKNHSAAASVGKTFKVALVLGVEPAPTINVTVSPNPAKGLVTIKSDNVIKTISVSNLLGAEVDYHQDVNMREYQLNLSEQSQGVYILKIVTDNNNSIGTRLVLTK